jgi:hypothetical protein
MFDYVFLNKVSVLNKLLNLSLSLEFSSDRTYMIVDY